ncbi:extensin family protein [Litorisediminicola beolgyonensis]|uniref:Extensin family protein n=1 Tax=Litorisediminicola beolgyonensis TaxID=1173614 RepID=A0ABW3ZK38_9RHOB
MRRLGLLLALLAAWPAEASLRPVARPDTTPAVVDVTLGSRLGERRPEMRPEIFEAALAAKIVARMQRLEPVPRDEPLESFPGFDVDIRAFADATPQAVRLTLRPTKRSEALVQKVMAKRRETMRGAICGDPDIQGEAVGYVPGRLSACGIQDAVKVRSVAGVPLSQEALIDCTTARALNQWVARAVKPAVGNAGGGVSQIRIAAHYACRTRNNQPGAKISEHGKGRAVDISAIRLRDGTMLTVLGGYRTQNQGPILQRMYKAACGIFGTTLGPDSDRYHQDHFHFDTARYRSGSYCGR